MQDNIENLASMIDTNNRAKEAELLGRRLPKHDIEEIKLALSQLTENDIKSNDFRNVIVLAVEKGNIEVIELLLADERIPWPRWAIQIAAGEGHVKIVELLLNHKRVDLIEIQIQVSIEDTDKNGHFEVVELFLADKRVGSASVGATSNYNQYIQGIHSLLNNRELTPKTIHITMQEAIRKGCAQAVKLLSSDIRINNRIDIMGNVMCRAYNDKKDQIQKILVHSVAYNRFGIFCKANKDPDSMIFRTPTEMLQKITQDAIQLISEKPDISPKLSCTTTPNATKISKN